VLSECGASPHRFSTVVIGSDRQLIPNLFNRAQFFTSTSWRRFCETFAMQTSSVLTVVTLFCLAILGPKAQGVSPAPDGGYAGGNTAEAQNALLSLTTGAYNTAVGFDSLISNTTNSFNTAIGAGALLANIANENTATDAGALFSNTTGQFNTATGTFALFSNIVGDENSAFGYGTLEMCTAGAGGNTAVGYSALFHDSSGTSNTAVGVAALTDNNSGNFNTASGYDSLVFNFDGSGNTAYGVDSLGNNTSGNNNTALGYQVGNNLDTGNNNIDIGYNVTGVAGESDTIRIGNTNISTTIIRGISGTTIASGATVFVATNGQLGTMTSSERFKQEIKPMDKASEALLALKPVTFCYKKEIDPAGTSQFGLVAEEVEKVNPDLVVRDERGKPYSVRYDQVNAMLLNEFLKEHKAFLEEQRKVQEEDGKIQEEEATVVELKSMLAKEETTITELKEEIEAVVAHAKEEDSKIQKVSDKVELNQSMRQLVANDS
jgi:Chaperone of endosialidase